MAFLLLYRSPALSRDHTIIFISTLKNNLVPDTQKKKRLPKT